MIDGLQVLRRKQDYWTYNSVAELSVSVRSRKTSPDNFTPEKSKLKQQPSTKVHQISLKPHALHRRLNKYQLYTIKLKGNIWVICKNCFVDINISKQPSFW